MLMSLLACDLILFAFYQYLMIALILALLCVLYHFKKEPVYSSFFALIATLIYEPFIALFVLCLVTHKKTRAQAAIPFFLIGSVLGFKLYEQWSWIGYKSQTSPFFERVLQAGQATLFMIGQSITTLWNPIVLTQKNLYELPQFTPYFSLIAILFIFERRLLLPMLAPFFLLVFARGAEESVWFAPTQLRYLYIVFPFLMISLALIFYRHLPPWGTQVLFTLFLIVNVISSSLHGVRVATDFRDLAKWVKQNHSIHDTTSAIIDLKIPVQRKELTPLLYNARSCLIEQREKVSLLEAGVR